MALSPVSVSDPSIITIWDSIEEARLNEVDEKLATYFQQYSTDETWVRESVELVKESICPPQYFLSDGSLFDQYLRFLDQLFLIFDNEEIEMPSDLTESACGDLLDFFKQNGVDKEFLPHFVCMLTVNPQDNLNHHGEAKIVLQEMRNLHENLIYVRQTAGFSLKTSNLINGFLIEASKWDANLIKHQVETLFKNPNLAEEDPEQFFKIGSEIQYKLSAAPEESKKDWDEKEEEF